MGLIEAIMGKIFGDGRNAIVETAEVFRVNADKSDERSVQVTEATLKQFAEEFAHQRKGVFDQFIDGVNRLPRPMLALGTIALFMAAMFDPDWFAERMLGVTLIPEPMWWLMGAIVSFYFGARHQAKGQDFQRSVAQTVALGRSIQAARKEEQEATVSKDEPSEVAPTGYVAKDHNAALEDWRAGRD